MVLMVFLSSRISPFTSTVIFFDRSPLATAVVTSAMLRTWPVRFAAMRLTLSVRSFQVPATPSTRAWPPSLPSDADLAGDAGDLAGEAVELVHHGVDGVLELQDLAAHLDGDLLREVAVRDRGRHLGDVAHLTGEVGRHHVDVVGEVRPGAGDAAHLRLAAELALRADLAGDAGHLARRSELSWSTMVLMVFLSSKISPRTSTVIFFDRSPFATAVVTSAMLRTWPVRFAAIELTLSVRSFQVPPTPSTCA